MFLSNPLDPSSTITNQSLFLSDLPSLYSSSYFCSPRVLEATKSTTIQTLEPGYENMDHYKVDFNAEERTLYQLDFEGIPGPIRMDVNGSAKSNTIHFCW